MLEFHPETVRAWCHGRWSGPRPSTIAGFAYDTRQLRPGELFVALRTERRDGHDFLHEALGRGASAALVARPRIEVALPQLVVHDPAAALLEIAGHHRQQFDGPVIGITGSCGKTSTKELLALLLGTDEGHRTQCNQNNTLGVPISLLKLDADRHRWGIIEVGISEHGEMAAMARQVEPDVGLLTAIAPAHLEGLRDVDSVATEKAKLLEATRDLGLCVFPAECLRYEALAALAERALVYAPAAYPTPSTRACAGVVSYCVAFDFERQVSRLTLDPESPTPRVFELPSASEGMARNAVAALTIASRLGLSDHVLRLRLLRWRPQAFRGEVVPSGNTTFYIDCYNSNPSSLADSVRAFQRLFRDGPRLLVLGSMDELGPEAPAWHERLGRSLRLTPADQVIALGPWREDILEGLRCAGVAPAQLRAAEDIASIQDIVAGFEGAVLLKGSRRYQLEMLLPEVTVRMNRQEAALC